MTKDTDKCVAITEIKFYSDYMEKYDTDTLDDIKINGESIADFNSDIFNYEFEYEGDKIPEITASATDNAAVTVVPATEDNPTAKIFVVSESGVNTRTYTIRMNNGKERLKQIESLDDNLEIYLVENESTENAPKFKIINHSDNAQTIRLYVACLLYTSDAADEEDSVDLGGRRSIKKKKRIRRKERKEKKKKAQMRKRGRTKR